MGLSLPLDNDYKNYIPIDKRKIYCGRKNIMPEGYDILGNNFMCHTKGIGIGKKINSKKKRKSVRKGRKRKSVRKGRKRKSVRKK